VWSGGRLRSPVRDEGHVCRTLRVRLVRSSLGPASTCIEDLRECTSSVASCSARPQHSHTACAIGGWSRGPRVAGATRAVCQAPDTTSASRAQKVEDGTSSVSARKHTARNKARGSIPFRAAIGDRLSGGVKAVYGALLGHELSFQANEALDLGRGRRTVTARRHPSLDWATR
jgi:hypothetical protein